MKILFFILLTVLAQEFNPRGTISGEISILPDLEDVSINTGESAAGDSAINFFPPTDCPTSVPACCAYADLPLKNCKRRGLTWGFYNHNCKLEIDHVGCSGLPFVSPSSHWCNPYVGDTPCCKFRPILCIKKLNLNRPAYDISCNPGNEAGCGWTGGFLGLTPRIQGCHLTSLAVADAFCQKYLGCGYKMAEHHDGRYINGMSSTAFANCAWNGVPNFPGGWTFYGYSNIFKIGSAKPISPVRFWVHINDQKANCWNK